MSELWFAAGEGMSSKLVGMVLDRYPVGGAECLLAVVLADCANPDGTSIFIGVPTMARLSRQSERSVQRQLLSMQASGWLQLVRSARGGRGTNHYRINPAWINQELSFERGDKLSPLAPASDCVQAVGIGVDKSPELSTVVTKPAFRGDTAVSPNPCYPNTFNPPLPPVETGGAENFSNPKQPQQPDSRTVGQPGSQGQARADGQPGQPATAKQPSPAGQGGAPGLRPPWRWRNDRKGIEKTAKHLGMAPWDSTWLNTGQGENFLEYTERVHRTYLARYRQAKPEAEPCS